MKFQAYCWIIPCTINHPRGTQFFNIKVAVLVVFKNTFKSKILKYNFNNNRSGEFVEMYVLYSITNFFLAVISFDPNYSRFILIIFPNPDGKTF